MGQAALIVNLVVISYKSKIGRKKIGDIKGKIDLNLNFFSDKKGLNKRQ